MAVTTYLNSLPKSSVGFHIAPQYEMKNFLFSFLYVQLFIAYILFLNWPHHLSIWITHLPVTYGNWKVVMLPCN